MVVLHKCREYLVGALFVIFWVDVWELRPVVDVFAMCLKTGAAYLQFDCPVIGMEPGWDDSPDGFDLDSWVDECIVTAASLLASISHHPVAGIAALLLLEEAVESVDDAQVVKGSRYRDAPGIAGVAKVSVEVAE